jgi:thymidylate synthase (FAD)
MKAELIDKMGDDIRVVNAARVSFDKESEWGWSEPVNGVMELATIKAGTVFTKEIMDDLMQRRANPAITFKNGLKPSDQKLLNYLAKHGHWTPFSHVMITMRETVPIFVARQRFKHMVGFTYNEISRRYVDTPPEFYVPDSWRKAAENKKQGSSDELITEYFVEDEDSFAVVKDEYQYLIERITKTYNEFIEAGVAPEQARMVLPQSMYTSYYTTGSLSAWARAYKLRSDPHSQKEIQDLAAQWNEIISGIPELKYSWGALTNG